MLWHCQVSSLAHINTPAYSTILGKLSEKKSNENFIPQNFTAIDWCHSQQQWRWNEKQTEENTGKKHEYDEYTENELKTGRKKTSTHTNKINQASGLHNIDRLTRLKQTIKFRHSISRVLLSFQFWFSVQVNGNSGN